MHLFRIILFLFAFTSIISSQNDLYMPRNVLDAYEKGTRSYDGRPGENYWQNSSDYKIKVSVIPETRLVNGWEQIVYYNNSPDTLTQIVFNIIQDLNKPGTARDFSFSEESLGEGVIITRFLINNSEIRQDNDNIRRRNTLMTVKIEDQPLPPGSTMNFEIEWKFTIPAGRNPRMGTYDSTSFFIAYWFPQIAVYDDIDGWDNLAHNGEQEFYNDFSNFDVEITVPNTFGVWGTGVLQNPEEVLTDIYLERYKKAWISDEVINIVTKDELNSGKIYKSDSSHNVWKYKADNVTDFTFSMSDHYLWDAVSLVVDKDSGRRVYIAAVYKKESKDFYEVADIARKTVNYFSYELPGVPFPFPSLTVFNGSGGMEFPMILNDGSEERRSGTVGLTSHEAAHQYFPFYMGINEEKYGWMDEGMATFIPFNFQEREGDYNPRARNVIYYERQAGHEMEMPPITITYLLTGWAERIAIYTRPGIAYDFLYYALGKDMFLKCFREYIGRWNGKHPIPYDFFFTFNEVSEMDLSWYWKPWFFQNGYPDLAVKDASFEDGTLRIILKKEGNIPTPVEISVVCRDNSVVNITETALIWEGNKDTIEIRRKLDSEPVSITLGSLMIPDCDRTNNYFNFKVYAH